MGFEVGERVLGGKVRGLLAEFVSGRVQWSGQVAGGPLSEIRDVFLNLVPCRVARQLVRFLLGYLDLGCWGGLGGGFVGFEIITILFCF